MAKPSIFSKDYEKKMKKRRLKIVIGIIVIIVIALGLFYQFKLKDMNFNQIVNNLQAWANNETVSNKDKPVEHKENQNEKEDVKNKVDEQKTVPPVESDLEFKLLNNEAIKFKVKEENGDKTFIQLETKGYYSNIAPNKKEAVIEDEKQNMFLINVNGEVKNITKTEYVSKKGDKYPKDVMLDKEKRSGVDYLWGVNATFIDDNTIAYISNLPYFGISAKNKYIWIYNIKDSTYKAIWNSASSELEILGQNEGKNNIHVKVGNQEYNLDNQGKLFKE